MDFMKERILVIPDIHGKDDWKYVVTRGYDKIIFLGDYVDALSDTYVNSFIDDIVEHFRLNKIRPTHENVESLIDNYIDTIHNGVTCKSILNTYIRSSKSKDEIIGNLSDIILYAKKCENVILLLGNHDLPYLHPLFTKFTCTITDLNTDYHRALRDLFVKNWEYFRLLYNMGNIVFSHAGISEMLWNMFVKFYSNDRITDIVEIVNNDLIGDTPFNIDFIYDGTFSRTSGFLWHRPYHGEYAKEFIQFIGHTSYFDTIDECLQSGLKSNVFLCDILNKQSKFLELIVEDNAIKNIHIVDSPEKDVVIEKQFKKYLKIIIKRACTE